MVPNDAIPNLRESKPQWLVADLRSDHAGETGAIWIYKGILLTTSEEVLKKFATDHLTTEQSHLEKIESFLDKKDRSVLIPLWKILGFLTGALPALIGPRAVFATISAVENFVVAHYQAQIQRLRNENIHPHISGVLQSCRDDEAQHEAEAASLISSQPSKLLRAWCRLVSVGSNAAVKLARMI
tara:strand:+ start:2932 stop:3483 length:552 start_codon:yes stop_codon:yes gene_type:complete